MMTVEMVTLVVMIIMLKKEEVKRRHEPTH